MTPKPIAQRTHQVEVPDDLSQASKDLCQPLDIIYRDGWMTSMWQPSADELRRLNAGEPVLLRVHGFVHPVVRLEVGATSESTPSTDST